MRPGLPAGASRGERSGALIRVRDNGSGLRPDHRLGLGLIGMRERAALIGADLQIESTAGRGTTIIVRIPSVVAAVKSA